MNVIETKINDKPLSKIDYSDIDFGEKVVLPEHLKPKIIGKDLLGLTPKFRDSYINVKTINSDATPAKICKSWDKFEKRDIPLSEITKWLTLYHIGVSRDLIPNWHTVFKLVYFLGEDSSVDGFEDRLIAKNEPISQIKSVLRKINMGVQKGSNPFVRQESKDKSPFEDFLIKLFSANCEFEVVNALIKGDYNVSFINNEGKRPDINLEKYKVEIKMLNWKEKLPNTPYLHETISQHVDFRWRELSLSSYDFSHFLRREIKNVKDFESKKADIIINNISMTDVGNFFITFTDRNNLECPFVSAIKKAFEFVDSGRKAIVLIAKPSRIEPKIIGYTIPYSQKSESEWWKGRLL